MTKFFASLLFFLAIVRISCASEANTACLPPTKRVVDGVEEVSQPGCGPPGGSPHPVPPGENGILPDDKYTSVQVLSSVSLSQSRLPIAHFVPELIECALPDWSTWKTQDNGTDYSFVGLLGIAPDIVDYPLTLPTSQIILSACLLSMVNYYGQHVPISPRNYPFVAVDTTELTEFGVYEGAFFGNLWGNSTARFSCQGDPEIQALENSPDRKWRRCTDANYACEMQALGNCSNYCSNYVEDYGYSQCTVNGTTYLPINVFLKSKRHCGYDADDGDDGGMF